MKENTSSNLILRALEAVRRDPVLAELVTNVGQLVSARAAQKDFVVNYGRQLRRDCIGFPSSICGAISTRS